MIEPGSYRECYLPMSPQQRNAEFYALFEALPSERRGYVESSDWMYDSVKNKIFFAGDIDEWGRKIEEGVDRMRHRIKSPLHAVLTGRLDVLLSFSHTTPSFRTDVLDHYERYYEMGIDREPSGRSEIIDELGELYHWDDPKKGGVFDSKEAPEIDRKAYQRAAQLQRLTQGMDERIEETLETDPEFQELLERVRTQGVSDRILESLLTDEERVKRVEAEEESDAYAEKIEQTWVEREARVRRWRLEYIEMFGDEP